MERRVDKRAGKTMASRIMRCPRQRIILLVRFWDTLTGLSYGQVFILLQRSCSVQCKFGRVGRNWSMMVPSLAVVRRVKLIYDDRPTYCYGFHFL